MTLDEALAAVEADSTRAPGALTAARAVHGAFSRVMRSALVEAGHLRGQGHDAAADVLDADAAIIAARGALRVMRAGGR